MEQNFNTREAANQDSANLAGLSAADAKEVIFGVIATLKLTLKEIRSLEEDLAKWKNRSHLALSKGMEELYTEAEKELERINQKLSSLRREENEYKNQIDKMRQQLPGLAARERSIDPVLLEQELLMALGKTEEEAKTERAFRELEKNSAAETELEALKAKMKADNEKGDPF